MVEHDDAVERASLTEWLQTQRAHVLGILEGLDDAQLRSAMLPSGWTFLGMIQHLAYDVEHYWFQCITGGASLDFFATSDVARDAWGVKEDVDPASVLTAYRNEIAAADAVIAATSLDAAPGQRDEWWGEWQVPSLRFILLHVIAETACHAGHLDAARELVDGRQWVTIG